MKKYLDEGNFVVTKWCGCRECEEKVKELMQASSRIMPLAQTLGLEDIAVEDSCVERLKLLCMLFDYSRKGRERASKQ